MASLTRTRAEHESRLLEEKKRAERGKNLVVLMLQHLTNAGYTGTVEALTAESGVSLAQYEVCDNIELISTLQEWEEYYELKFARKPKIVKKLSQYSEGVNGPGAMAAKGPNSGADSKENGAKGAHGDPGDAAGAVDPTGLVVSGHVPGSHELNGKNANGRRGADDDTEGPGHWENRLRKAGLPPAMAANAELRELASWLQRDMIQRNPNVRWDDIAELQDVKRVLKESLVMPLRYPEYFTGLLQPWKGVLLYGPPGTGKTLLAKAVATECNTTFFNISASSIVSKWRGDSEKLVRVLFELARHHAPSTIFVDEIDALMGSRGESGEHEGSRRMKTELLVQMDGLLSSSEQVFLLAATNLPWELDMALLRRLEKRILVPFPTAKGRETILMRTLPKDRLHPSADCARLADLTEGYSGSDLVLVAKEAAMRPLRRLLATLDLEAPRGNARAPQPGLIDADDFSAALSSTKPTVQTYAERYAKWEEEFGST